MRVQSGARSAGPVSFQAGVLRLRVTVPAEKGNATEAALALTAELLGVPKSRVTLVRRATSREKLIDIEGLAQAQVNQRLASRVEDKPAG
ncbi:MAG: DUF167 domain-containing protein [Dehalococcoidia bacterium]|nr:DUF167 domain-containing protein [Dehalococcoidia bacterium]